ncbi:MAG: hypothetical protein PHP50_07080 [Lachnospiraceae bacterium]|nr:hypothetical protein [Lachnospiraceae bacterium]
MERQRILPFYMAYPLPIYQNDENTVMQDLEYLQQMYPAEAKEYQKKIVSMLDKLDYEDSMIYDEYPDRWQLFRLAESITKSIENDSDEEIDPMRRDHIMGMVQILLFYEVYKRRRKEKTGYLKF